MNGSWALNCVSNGFFLTLQKRKKMEREAIIDETVKKLNRLPLDKLRQVEDFVDFVFSRIDDKLLVEGIQKLTSESKSFEYLKDEEDIYSVNDLKEKYR